MINSSLGQTLSGASADSRQLYETALHQLQCYIGDPVATIDGALTACPTFVMGHVLRAYLHLLGTEIAGLPVARESHAAAAALPASDRERGHIAAVGRLVDGCWHDAGAILEDLAIDDPRDVLALQVGHLVDFYTGNTRMLRDRIGRALPAWHDGMPGYHAVVGMHAFGLEETGDYAQAERQGRRAVALEPRDAWGWHAVAHVMEMQGRQADGIAWLRSDPAAWAEDNFFAVHNWWHLALYHLDRGEIDAVLALFDGPIYGQRSTIVLDMIDASALLWRLLLRGVDVGDRWSAVADNWEPLANAGNYAFNDAHAMMAFVGVGRRAAMERLLAAQARAMQGTDDNARFTREVGHPVTLAIQAFGDDDYQRCTALLRPVRNIAHRFGGSHAQRDLLDLTLIEAALRGGQRSLAAALTAERLAVKAQSPLARLLAERAASLAGSS
jgi:hypothetical protein